MAPDTALCPLIITGGGEAPQAALHSRPTDARGQTLPVPHGRLPSPVDSAPGSLSNHRRRPNPLFPHVDEGFCFVCLPPLW